ncbi:MAG: TIGR04190 family B12-binding domain/radical SAM domain protein [Verrucomicrobia bacterium]|nr:TIGR04190 family B12-binding domain/radical SAM domain protein [Verrucomicrobiota bacterium]
MSKIDLLLLHPPSVYDFRERAIMYGPVSDLIPSSPVFEMYPLGFLTMTDYLEQRGLRVRIVNLALRMMNDRAFDVPAFLATLAPEAVGIDLHWLPHAHGSIEIAKLVKRIHPKVPVIFGGLSSTYFHRELIQYPAVDYVLRGDSIEPPLHDLLMSLKAGQEPENIPNLTWKANGVVRENPGSFNPSSLDYADLAPDRMIRMVLRYRDLQSVLPFNGWWKNPITAVFTVKGCSHQCATCGNSRPACAILSKRARPLFRSPESLVRNMIDISRFSRGPIFLVGDLGQAGTKHANQVLDLLRGVRIKNEIVFEFFQIPPPGFLRKIDQSVKNWSLELSPESHDPEIRRVQDETTFFTNSEMEDIIHEALALRCHRIDVFFMIGLPRQTQTSVMDSIRYCERLFQLSDNRLSCFISPMGPFLDPGSRIFEEPERFGYRLFARTLEEHRQLLVQRSWKHILNYETNWMTRDELVEATYAAAESLNVLKLKYGRIPQARGEEVARRIVRARSLKERLDSIEEDREPGNGTLEALMGEIHEFSVSTVCDKRELFWKRHVLNFRLSGILWALKSCLTGRLASLGVRKEGGRDKRPLPSWS